MAAEKTMEASGRLLSPVLRDGGAAGWDVGPLGHRDLFGNAEEWTRGAFYGSDRSANGCDVPFDVPDAAEVPSFPPGTRTNVGHLGTILGNVKPADGSGSEPALVSSASLSRTVEAPEYFSGFRCAFPL